MATRSEPHAGGRCSNHAARRLVSLTIVALLLLVSWSCAGYRGKSALRASECNARVAALEARVDSLQFELANLRATWTAIADTSALSPAGVDAIGAPVVVGVTSARCEAATQSGTRCTRNAEVGSLYCWQHQQASSTLNSRATPTTPPERTILTGPRGGKYYINSKGKKTYIRKKK